MILHSTEQPTKLVTMDTAVERPSNMVEYKEMAPIQSSEVAMIDCVVNSDIAEHAIVTPRPITPEHEVCRHFFNDHHNMESEGLARELEEARLDAQQSSEALDNLVEGIRMVKRILERDRSIVDSTKDRIEELKALNSISEKLHGVLGSDLMGLLNAADMVREHAKLSVHEASALVHDVAEARQEAEESQRGVRQLKKISRYLHKENTSIRKEVNQLRRERKALVMEVKFLREEAEVTKKYDTWRLLEHHVLDSIEIHERVLKTSSTPKQNQFSHPESSGSKQEETYSLGDGSDCEGESSGAQSQPKASNESDETQATESDTEANQNQSNPSNVTQVSSSEGRNEAKPNEGEPTMVTATTPTRRSASLSAFSGFRNFFSPQDVREQRDQPSHPAGQSASVTTSDRNSRVDDNRQTSGEDVACKTPGSNSAAKHNSPAAPHSNIERSTVSNRTKSPVPGLEEASGWCTDDCSSGTRGSKLAQEDCPKLPMEFSFQIPYNLAAPALASPLLSPHGSPAGVGLTQPKPICNEKILRTLAIPSREDESTGGHVLYTRTTLEPGLYEC
jgi:hypothetical protein